jgi:hypothetical protein
MKNMKENHEEEPQMVIPEASQSRVSSRFFLHELHAFTLAFVDLYFTM